MKTNFNFLFICVLSISLMYNCSNDDDSSSIEEQTAPWENQVEQLKLATSKYSDFSEAEADGLIDVSGYVPNMGHHFLNPANADGTFKLEQPEIILYVPDEDGIMQMVAVEYSIAPEDPDNPGLPPEGFTGSDDEWHFNEELGQWQLHVWTMLENPSGIFASFNPAIGD